MPKETVQTLKVEQTNLAEVLTFPSRPYVDEKAVPEKKGTSPNQGHEATGRSREHLTPQEMDVLLSAAKKSGRNSHRNFTMILLIYRHGLRVEECSDLQWCNISFEDGTIYIRRCKGSESGTHPLSGDELRALRKLQRESAKSAFVFVTSKGTPIKKTAIAAMIKRLGEGLFEFPIHAHMLRHACGYYLANKGIDLRRIQEYLGHKNIQNTVRYTALSATKFRGLWD
ncbi:tyrosine-type recombinase/integrase [Leptolyngbya sp. AN03gr2]|uniref:tyrosine-type recombinase/integrase n=1 Tax=unclassified Leptolyngbya TaxID=2650499 RepID=UPI003D31334D